jgi:hypothetical protein
MLEPLQRIRGWRRPFDRQDRTTVDHEGAAQQSRNDGSQHDRGLVGGDQVLTLTVAEYLPGAPAGSCPPHDRNACRRLGGTEALGFRRVIGEAGGSHRHPGQTQPLQLVLAREAFQMGGGAIVKARPARLQARQQAV